MQPLCCNTLRKSPMFRVSAWWPTARLKSCKTTHTPRNERNVPTGVPSHHHKGGKYIIVPQRNLKCTWPTCLKGNLFPSPLRPLLSIMAPLRGTPSSRVRTRTLAATSLHWTSLEGMAKGLTRWKCCDKLAGFVLDVAASTRTSRISSLSLPLSMNLLEAKNEHSVEGPSGVQHKHL